jgi:hypothetical protein
LLKRPVVDLIAQAPVQLSVVVVPASNTIN